MTGAAITGVLALGFGALSVWQQVKGKSGSDFAIVACILVMVSCVRAGA